MLIGNIGTEKNKQMFFSHDHLDRFFKSDCGKKKVKSEMI